MLTRIAIRNFKRFEETEIELGERVVFIGPNNSGKTSAMQALALWDVGVKQWLEKRSGKGAPKKRPGVTVSRRDLLAIPHPSANLLWRGRHTRNVSRKEGRQTTKNIRIDVIVEGVTDSQRWECGLEFDYANEESFYCRPLLTENKKTPERMPVPEQAGEVNVAFLPPMSGLAAKEERLESGAVDVRVGEGRTAEILRNLCLQIAEKSPFQWESLVQKIESLFGVSLESPRYVQKRSEITMEYREHGSRLDLSSSGRGLQQTLLILAYMYAHPNATILLDEPDAHLEILRQRHIYNLIGEVATDSNNQIIAASHSEVLLNEAAERDIVISFVGAPHRITDRGSQTRKALAEIGYDQYYQAEQTGWVLYLEGSTDLAILKSFAERIGHEAGQVLERPFVHYVGNQLKKAEDHFYGLRESLPNLKGVALFDRDVELPPNDQILKCLVWEQREIENYLCTPETLRNYARDDATKTSSGPLFVGFEVEKRLTAMDEAILEIQKALTSLSKGDPWGVELKVSDEFLDPVFKIYFEKLDLPNLMSKTNFNALVRHVPEGEIDSEITTKLDAILEVANAATPAQDD